VTSRASVSAGVGDGSRSRQGHENAANARDADLGAGADDLLVAAEVTVNRAGGHPSGGDHTLDRGGVETFAREAPPRAGQDVLAALFAGLVAQAGHDTKTKRKEFFALSRDMK
jgi:hypothetical protein